MVPPSEFKVRRRRTGRDGLFFFVEYCHILVYHKRKGLEGTKMKKDTISRSIYYYNAMVFCRDVEGELKCSKKTNSLLGDVFSKIQSMQAENDADIMIKVKSDNKLFMIVDNDLQDRINFRIVLSRKDAIPFVEKDGKLESLTNYLDKNQNIAEITHGVYFKEYGVFGIEYNFSGARSSAVARYLEMESDIIDYVRLSSILQMNMYLKLHKKKDYSLFDIAIKNNSILHNKLMEHTSVFRASGDFEDVETYEVILKKRKTKKNGYKGFNLPISYDLLEDILINNREDITKFKVSQSEMTNPIDLLADKFVSHITVVKKNERTVDSKNMYECINSYFISVVSEHCEKVG